MSGKCRSVRGDSLDEATSGSSVRQERAKGSAARTQRTARLTIDVTLALRGRIRAIAVRCGLPVAEMLRELLEREFESRSERRRKI
jgi:hypothetical protein